MARPRQTMRRYSRPAVCLALGWVMLAAVGCESADQRHARRMMWYRQPPTAAPQGNTMSVGRFGLDAQYAVWPGSGSIAGEGRERGGPDVGRFGTSAEYATWDATSVGGEPTANAGVSGRSGQAGTTLGVQGGPITVGETPDRGAEYGITPPG